ncbi:MAG: hypothetical protein ABSH20_29750 [Tepidisphaeraceae bacterium]|jgi:hypothetical protein
MRDVAAFTLCFTGMVFIRACGPVLDLLFPPAGWQVIPTGASYMLDGAFMVYLVDD